MKILIDQIVPNPEQPRQNFDQAGLEELAQSIREMGMIQPITVEISEDGETYILHDGERRWRAAKIAGLEEIPAEIVEPLGDDIARRDRLARAVVANVQRQDLSPLETARAYQNLHDLGLSDQQIADRIGKSRPSVANARRLLELPDDVHALINEEHVSERIMMALLPLYQMPEEALKLAQNRWNSPKRLLDDIRSGHTNNSDQVRSRVRSIMKDGTSPLNNALFPSDHEFDENGLRIQSPRCDDCVQRVKLSQSEWRCPILECYRAKEQRWEVELMQAASEVHGIPILPEDADWNEYRSFYGDRELVQGIVAKGCENLRLKFVHWSGANEYRLPDYPQVAVVCYGTDDQKQCTCLMEARAENPELVEDPDRAERERNRAEIQRLTAACGHIVAMAIDSRDIQVWRWMLAEMWPHGRQEKEWDLGEICQIIGERIVERQISWEARQDPDLARKEIGEALARFGLSIPEPTNLAGGIRRRFERIQGWIVSLDRDQVTLEAVQGNLDNLERITDEFDAISHEQLDNEAFDGFLQDLADAWETLDSLKYEINGRHVGVGAQTLE